MASKPINAYAVMSKSAPCTPWTYEAHPLGDDDVEIKISHCGVCHSDIHTIDSGDGWGSSMYPLIVGHEVIGTVAAKGKNVKKFAVGERVGLGAQAFACHKADCEECSHGHDNCCPKMVFTYNSKYADGHVAYGGYAEAVRVSASMLVHIPDALPSDAAAPLLCAGTTVWGPLQEFGVKHGVSIGVVGLGGLGHLAVQFAAKLGADVTVVSHSAKKKDDALNLGARHFCNSHDENDMKAFTARFHVLLVCASATGQNWDQYLSLLKPHGKLVLVAAPEEPVKVFPFSLIVHKVSVHGSLLAPLKQIEAMLEFAAKHHVLPQIEKVPMAKVNDALARLRVGDVKYRFVLENPAAADL